MGRLHSFFLDDDEGLKKGLAHLQCRVAIGNDDINDSQMERAHQNVTPRLSIELREHFSLQYEHHHDELLCLLALGPNRLTSDEDPNVMWF